ncbi:MAG: hypothetical protein U5L45_04525 [Saprospiraceae bacterium]|nr:hypothetical protein [Saprospiraceae bacterium]
MKAVITQFFVGMKTGDTTAIRVLFTEGVIFQTIGRRLLQNPRSHCFKRCW